jgi:hypothetical protein
MGYDTKEFEKFKDDAVRGRELDEAIGKYRMGLFLAVLGPGAILVMYVLGIVPGREVRWGVVATVPLSLLVTGIRWLGLPSGAKFARQTLSIGFMTLAAVAATFILGKRFSLLPF